MTQAEASDAFPAPEHDHDRCLEEAMVRARKAFDDKGLKLTPLRRAVFGEIASSHRAIGFAAFRLTVSWNDTPSLV